MALGHDIQLKFNTGSPAGDPTEFPFNTSGGELTSIDLGIVDYYCGDNTAALLDPNIFFNITLETESRNSYNNIQYEFNRPVPESFNWAGSTLSFELDTLTVPHLNNNFTLHPASLFKPTVIDFGELYQSFIHHGSSVDLDFTSARTPTWNQINFTLVPDPSVGNLCSTDPVAIDFEIIPTFYAAFHGTDNSVVLTTDDLRINLNLLVCDNPTSDVAPVDGNGDVIFEYNSECDPGDIIYPALTDFGSNVILELLVTKNTNINIDICETLVNPALNIDNHDFIYARDYFNYVCTDIESLGYHGSSVSFLLANEILIDDVDPEHGHYVEFDISVYNQFYLNPEHGAYSDTDFSIFPAAELDGDADHGAYADMELFTTIIFYDVEADAGEYSDTDLSTYLAPEFEPVAEFGTSGDFDLLTAPVIQVDKTEHGSNTYADLTSFPAIQVDLDFYHGQFTDGDMVVSIVIDGDFYAGSESVFDLEIRPSEGIGVLDNPHGAYGEVDLAYTPTLDMDGYHGEYSVATMNITTTLEMDGYNGEYADGELTRVLPPELDADAYQGELVEADLALTRALFPRAYTGVYADFDLDDHPAIELDIDGYHGVYAIVTDLAETEFNTAAHHGSSIEDVDLQVTVNFPLDEILHGSSMELDEISRAPTLDMEATHGGEGFVSNFFVPEGEHIIMDAYGGASLTPSLHAPVHAILIPRPINASLAMYDGFGGLGGLNHCELCPDDLDPMFGDNVIRLGDDPLGIEDQLIIDFDETGFNPWNQCGGYDAHFEWEFQTNKRFEVTAYAGESCEMFIPLEIMGLFGGDEIPLDRLYHYEYWAIINRAVFPLEEIKYETGAAVWDHPDDFVAFYEAYFSADLTLTAFGQWYHGAYAVVDTLAVPKPSWVYALGNFNTGAKVRIEFEPLDYIRFCKGYIVPNGNSVVFEFDTIFDEDCTIFLAGHGSGMTDFILRNYVNFYPKSNYDGSYSWASLVVQKLWTALGYHGHNVWMQFYAEPEFEPKDYSDGSYAQCTFYEPPIDGYCGIAMEIDDLVVPGPAVRWVTETQCLPNEYIPLTPDGDQDFTLVTPDENGVIAIPGVPVEYIPYKTTLLAHCITYDASQEDEG